MFIIFCGTRAWINVVLKFKEKLRSYSKNVLFSNYFGDPPHISLFCNSITHSRRLLEVAILMTYLWRHIDKRDLAKYIDLFYKDRLVLKLFLVSWIILGSLFLYSLSFYKKCKKASSRSIWPGHYMERRTQRLLYRIKTNGITLFTFECGHYRLNILVTLNFVGIFFFDVAVKSHCWCILRYMIIT